FGYPDTQTILTTALLDLVVDADQPRLKTLLNQPFTDTQPITLLGQQADGQSLPVEMRFTPIQYDGKNCLQLSVHEVTGNPEHARQLANLKQQDLLTRLHNIGHFTSHLENAINAAVNQGIFSFLLVLQIDNFADIKATIGVANTNQILTDISRFLRESINKPFSAARLSEDEFGLLLKDANSQEAMSLVSFIKSKINNHITSAILPNMQLSCSAGITAVNDFALDADDMINRARTNLRIPVTGTDSGFRTGDRMEPDINAMSDYLRSALDKGLFKLLFQPLVNLKDEGPAGYEILLRMLDSDGNEVSPRDFIPVANMIGLGQQLDQMVVSRALSLIEEGESKQSHLMINLTTNTLLSPTFPAWLSEQSERKRKMTEKLIFQISEIDLFQNQAQVLAFTKALAELNFKCAIIHYGCALEPARQLKLIRPVYIKLDQSLIRDILYSPQQQQNLKTIIEDLHRLGYTVAAPRVEDITVLPQLFAVGIDLVQGFCLQSPSQEMNYEFIDEQEITMAEFQP
ncbi:MAG: GGDEF and EAL domain-containing protein, partial [Pseudohongiellaceae bacterium]